MREEIVKVFKFEELSDKSKEVAREWFRNSLNEDFEPYTTWITETFEEELKALSFPHDDVEWRLSHRQGDGVAFYGHIDDEMMGKIVERMYDEYGFLFYDLYKELTRQDITINANIYRNHFGYRYSHQNTMEVELDCDDIDTIMEYIGDVDYEENEEEYHEVYAEIEGTLEGIKSFLSDEVKEVSRKLENIGYQEIEYRYSDESIDENILANGYEFTEDGEIW
jgi:hypothetical protein